MVAEYRDITRTYADLVGKITDLLDSGMNQKLTCCGVLAGAFGTRLKRRVSPLPP